MVELRRVTTMRDEELAYREIALLYEQTFGERIRAGVEWVAPLFHACVTGVRCDHNVGKGDQRRETIARAVDVLAAIFHGREHADLLRLRTPGLRHELGRDRTFIVESV